MLEHIERFERRTEATDQLHVAALKNATMHAVSTSTDSKPEVLAENKEYRYKSLKLNLKLLLPYNC